MNLTTLINHPEQMNKDTLYELRSLLAIHPYFQTARLLMLQNMFLMHDPSFDSELRKAAVFIADRRTLFNLVEAAHYQLRQEPSAPVEDSGKGRTISLIDDFLDSIPKDEEEVARKRKPTPADASVDYVAYLLETENQDTLSSSASGERQEEAVGHMKGQALIDNFIDIEGGKIQLKEKVDYMPDIDSFLENDNEDVDEGYFTETLAKIYVKQGRYSKALEIIQRLNLNFPKKNAYFADQIRFLEKLILNNKQNN